LEYTHLSVDKRKQHNYVFRVSHHSMPRKRIHMFTLVYLVVIGLDIIHSQSEGCACTDSNVHSVQLWIALFVTRPPQGHLEALLGILR